MIKQALFASSLPEIVAILGARNKFTGSLEKPKGKHHVILCGQITALSISAFLSDFYQSNRPHGVKVAILNRLLYSYFLQVRAAQYTTYKEPVNKLLVSRKSTNNVQYNKIHQSDQL